MIYEAIIKNRSANFCFFLHIYWLTLMFLILFIIKETDKDFQVILVTVDVI